MSSACISRSTVSGRSASSSAGLPPNQIPNKACLKANPGNCILYSLNLVKILTVENQSNINLYEQFNKLYEILNEEDWIKKFIFWELEVIKLVGYDINFNEYVDVNDLKNNKLYVKTSDGSKEIPFFLLKDDNTKINNDLLKDGLKIVGDFLNKSVLIPNNINYPLSRSEFIKLI